MNKVTYKVSETTFSAFLTECEDEKQILLFMEHSKNTDSENVTITEITEAEAESLEKRGMSVVDIEDELKNLAVEMVEEDEDLFIELVEELDSWNGFADGYRAYYMDELNEFYTGRTALELLDDMTEDFNKRDEFFYFSIWGLESTDDKAELYHDHTTEEEVVDNVMDCFGSLWISNAEFEEIVEAIA